MFSTLILKQVVLHIGDFNKIIYVHDIPLVLGVNARISFTNVLWNEHSVYSSHDTATYGEWN